MSDAIPAEIVRLIRERHGLLWICQRYDLAEGAAPHDYDVPVAEAVLRYRPVVTETDRAIAGKYWEAGWLEGALSPFLRACREAAKENVGARPIVVLGSEWDTKAQIDPDEFFPICVLPGLLDNSAPADAKYGILRKRQRERVSWELSRRLTQFPRRALIVLGAQTQDDVASLYEVLEDQSAQLRLFIVWPKDNPPPRSPQSSLVQVDIWRGSSAEFAEALEAAGAPGAEQVPEWAIRVLGKTITLSAGQVAGVAKRFALLTEQHLSEPRDFSVEDLQDFLDGSLDNWKGFGVGLPIPRSYKSDRNLNLPEEVLAIIRAFHSDNAPGLTGVINLPSFGGSGATTAIRQAAYHAAQAGYPTLILRPAQVDVDIEEVSAFATSLYRVAQSVGLVDMPPILVVLDVEHSRFVRNRELAQRLAVEGRKAIILEATQCLDSSDRPVRKPRWTRLPSYRAEATVEEVVTCARELRKISERWHLPIEIPDESAWRHYEMASRWRSPGNMEESTHLFWVGLRYFLTSGMDFTTAERALEALGRWIERRSARVSDPTMRSLVDNVAALGAIRIISPLTTILRPITGGVFKSELLQALQELSDLVVWGEYAEGLGDQVLRFIHPALAEEYLRQQGAATREQQIATLKPLLSTLSPGNPADVWLAETLASDIVPAFGERRDQQVLWDWRLEMINSIPAPVRDSSKTILHHWARCLYQSADSNQTSILSSDETQKRLVEAIEKLKKAIDLPRRVGKDEHPSHLYNTLGTAWARYAQFLRATLGRDDLEAWDQACKAFNQSIAISNSSNVDALLAFATRLIRHATTQPQSENRRRTLDDLAQALSLVDQAQDLIDQLETPDYSELDDLMVLRSQALYQLSNEENRKFIVALKNSGEPDLGYYCEARQILQDGDDEKVIARALGIFDQADERGIRLGVRSIALRISLLTRDVTQRFDFVRLAKLYQELRASPNYLPRAIDMFRNAVICYQIDKPQQGADEFRRLREQARRVGAVPLRVRDFWRDMVHPDQPRRAHLRVLRVLSDWRGEAHVEELNQSVPVRPRHFRPPLREREIRECTIRFEFNGPLAVPQGFPADELRESSKSA